MANPARIERGSREYKNLEAVAKMLEAVSPNEAEYVVEDVYFDCGQNWMWTTICRRGFRECQILNPKEWGWVIDSEGIAELAEAAELIRLGKYFGDKERNETAHIILKGNNFVY